MTSCMNDGIGVRPSGESREAMACQVASACFHSRRDAPEIPALGTLLLE